MIKKKEVYGRYYCERAKTEEGQDYYECIYDVEYIEHEVEEYFDAHNEMGDIQTYMQSGVECEIVSIDCWIRHTDNDSENKYIPDYVPPEKELRMIMDHLIS